LPSPSLRVPKMNLPKSNSTRSEETMRKKRAASAKSSTDMNLHMNCCNMNGRLSGGMSCLPQGPGARPRLRQRVAGMKNIDFINSSLRRSSRNAAWVGDPRSFWVRRHAAFGTGATIARTTGVIGPIATRLGPTLLEGHATKVHAPSSCGWRFWPNHLHANLTYRSAVSADPSHRHRSNARPL
jgi:hypothetical protein